MRSRCWPRTLIRASATLRQAIGLAERAVGLTNHQQAAVLDVLAAAYAAHGRFGEAVATPQAALKLVADRDPERIAGGITARLVTYKARKPYIESPRLP